ncbi:hypothetical protein DFR57_11943 [Saliterribacillus persicus]|uniref:Uncharacterized protein n=1 Tax=Saliterribacillus persicus TaxID=930114 RepID=A0A368X9P6_9BACI|nr:hypothetical protein DFR57_11943 [Saliterribacillus persicus]
MKRYICKAFTRESINKINIELTSDEDQPEPR